MQNRYLYLQQMHGCYEIRHRIKRYFHQLRPQIRHKQQRKRHYVQLFNPPDHLTLSVKIRIIEKIYQD